MPSLKQLLRRARVVRADLITAYKELQESEAFRHACGFTIAGAFLALLPELAHAGIYNGGLCQGYQQIMDNEMVETVSLAAAAGGVVAWLMDEIIALKEQAIDLRRRLGRLERQAGRGVPHLSEQAHE